MDLPEPEENSGSQDIHSSTKRIKQEIKNLEKELQEIQDSCQHQNYSLKNCPQGQDRGFNLKRVCDICSLDMGYPTQEEINKWVIS